MTRRMFLWMLTPPVNLPATRGGDARGPEEIAADLRLEARNRF